MMTAHSTLTTTGIGRAHGKVILLGEHSVVYGYPAIALPTLSLTVQARAQRSPAPQSVVDGSSSHHGHRFSAGAAASSAMPSGPQIAVAAALRDWQLATETVDVDVGCEIPLGRGLGSSAACAAAAVRAVADLYRRSVSADSVYRLVQCGEQHVHGRASGVDAACALSSEPIRFHRGVARPMPIAAVATVVVADSGTSGNTHRAVAVVRARHAEPGGSRLLEQAGALAAAAPDDLATGNWPSLGNKLLEFHGLLVELGISSPKLDRLVSAAEDAGAFGAKLTGGGLGGCVLALTDTPQHAATIRDALLATGAAQTWTIEIGGLTK